MKIAVLSFTSGKAYRGVETVVHELCNRWTKREEVRVFQMGSKQEGGVRYKIEKIGTNKDWKVISSLVDNRLSRFLMVDKYHWTFFRLTVKVIRELNKWQPDIVIPINRGWQAALIRLFCWFKGVKMVVSGQAGYKDKWSLITRPNVFIALNERNARWARKYSCGVRVEVIPNGVDMKLFKPSGKKMRLDLERPIILCVAGGEPYKRVEETVRAVRRLRKGGLLLVGGNERQEKLGNELLGARFLRMKVAYGKMPDVYRAVDIFTLVSESSEAFALVYLEALASGLPVVAPDDNLRKELLGKKGIFVQDATDEKEYALKIVEAIRRGKSKPSKHWLKKFDWDKIAKKYQELFNDLIRM